MFDKRNNPIRIAVETVSQADDSVALSTRQSTRSIFFTSHSVNSNIDTDYYWMTIETNDNFFFVHEILWFDSIRWIFNNAKMFRFFFIYFWRRTNKFGKSWCWARQKKIRNMQTKIFICVSTEFGGIFIRNVFKSLKLKLEEHSQFHIDFRGFLLRFVLSLTPFWSLFSCRLKVN